MMKVSFPGVDESFLRNKVDNGYYSSISEAIRDMVRKQREIENRQFLDALEVGERAVQEGKTQEFSDILFDVAVSTGVQKAKDGKTPINKDVIQQ